MRRPDHPKPAATAPASAFVDDLRQLHAFMSPARRRNFLSVLALMLLGAIMELVAIGSVVPFLSLLAGVPGQSDFSWIDRLFEAAGADSRDERLIAASVLLIAAALAAGAVRLQLAWSTQHFVLSLGHEVAVEIQRRTLAQPYSYHVSRNSSETIASLEKVQSLVFSVLLQLMQAITAAFIAAFIMAALIRIDPVTAGLALVTFAIIYALVSMVTRKRLARNSAVVGAAYEQRIQIIQESLGGIRDIIIDNSQATYLEEFRKVDRRFSSARATTAFMASAPRFVIEAAGTVFIAALAIAISGREGSLAQALPTLGAVALGAQRLLPLVQQLYQGWTNFAGNRSVARQVLNLLALPVEEETPSAQPGKLAFAGQIRFDKVSFTYPGRRRPALESIDLDIRRGSRVALVGPTGSGKSTLADLLMGLLVPTDGTISIDGVPLTAANRRAWQRSIAHVPQAIFLTDASIARNIALGVPPERIDEERLREAAAVAQIDSFIASLPEGYETFVGERGVRLSGGQRQRLGIARAIYKQAPVLVLDEATNALDDDSEMAVIRALDARAAADHTVIVIAHRSSTVEHCDLVVRLDNGRISQMGSVAQVLGGTTPTLAGTKR